MTEDSDKLAILSATATAARDLELEVVDLEAQLKVRKDALHKLYFETLPDLLDDVGFDRIGVPASGNKPGVDYRMRPYFSANIAASWPQTKRQQAFDLLAKLRAEDLIKTEVSVKLPKGSIAIAKKFVDAGKAILGITPDLKQTVHAQTLTAWLRDLYDRGLHLPTSDLEKLGASIGRIVRPEERKD